MSDSENENEETSIRDDIAAAVAEVAEAEAPPEPTSPKEDPEGDDRIDADGMARSIRERDPTTGRFVRKESDDVVVSTGKEAGEGNPPETGKPDAAAEPATAGEPEAAAPENQPDPDNQTKNIQLGIAPPNSWSKDAKGKWHEIPEDIRKEIGQRELDIHKGFSNQDENAVFGKDMRNAVAPYMDLIQAEGATPAQAVSSLMNTARVLRTGTPEQKHAALMAAAAQYGVNLNPAPQPGQPVNQPANQPAQNFDVSQLPPAVQQYVGQMQTQLAETQQIVSQWDQRLSQNEQQHQAALANDVKQEVDTFAAAEGHEHYETVKGHMSALIRSGLSSDLQDAYDQACYANPDVRATLLARDRVERDQKRREEQERKATEAKRRDVSVTGAPGTTTPSSKTANDRSLREELSANFASAASGGGGV